ncbi:MAG: TIGR00730 family Rossman fold protein [Gemmatimonadaceae bacterium]
MERSAPACAVFCGSRTPASAVARRSVQAFGRHLATRGVDLLYGAVDRGVMHMVAHASRNEGGRVLGFTTRTFHAAGLTPKHLAELHIARSLSARKAAILRRADFVAVLPGGVGTLDELFEALALIETGAISMPVGVLNVGGYYDPIRTQMEIGERAGLVNPRTARQVLYDASPRRLIDRLLAAAGDPDR